MVIGMPLSGYLSAWFGWTASFYFYGKRTDPRRSRAYRPVDVRRRVRLDLVRVLAVAGVRETGEASLHLGP